MLETEHEVKQLLENYGIKRPEYWIVPQSEFSDIQGILPPEKRFVLKVLDANIKHKSEIGALVVDVSRDDVGRVLENLRCRFGEKPVLIEEYIPHSIEFILGAKKDEDFEGVVGFGGGGFLTELYGDIVFRKMPLTREEIVKMVNSTRISAVFKGFRNLNYDYEPVIKAVLGIQRIFDEKGAVISELEINPLIISDSEPVALDAKIILNK
ncbi:MAG: acetate--CoA ligase family protein [Thermoplasmata archaeon]|nr:acetate--CoA ligase family protein [Thermoplasmata archaeon]